MGLCGNISVAVPILTITSSLGFILFVIIGAVVAIVVVLLAGGAVSLAGPIGFVGLVAPHLVRFMVGVDYRWILPYSALMGAILVIIGDMVARIIIRPQEVPVGVMMALIGAPFFIYLARWKVKS